jgi:hypothetical protein
MIFVGKSPWLACALLVLGGSVFLSACGSAAPTAPDYVVAADLPAAEAGKVSALATTAIVYCPRCFLLIDPVRVPPNSEVTVFLSMANLGTDVVGNVHVTGYLFGATGGRIRVAEVDQAGPRPRQAVSFTVSFAMPSGLPSGAYRVEMAFDPENPALPDGTWVSDQILRVP